MSQRPPELDLLLRCCSRAADPRHDRLSDLSGRMDPNKFLNLAAWHQVRPLLSHRLFELSPDCLSETLRSELRAFARANAANSLHLSSELLRLVDELQRIGITAIPFKGPVLAERLHGNAALREFVDLDLFVPSAEIQSARTALVDLGYASEMPLRAANDPAFFKSECEYILRGANDLIVELHWSVAPRMLAYDVDWNGIWKRITSTQFCGRSVPAFHDSDLMLLLLLHGAKHGWSRLKWLCDVAWFVEEGEIDYEFLLGEAEERGYSRALLIGLDLAAQMFAVRLPDTISDRCKADRSVGNTNARLVERMMQAEPLSDAALLRFRTMSRERQADKLRVLGRTIFAPNQADYGNSRMRRPLGAIHYFARPLRLLRKRLASAN